MCIRDSHDGAPQVSVVPLSSKLKDSPVHVILNPKDVSGFGLSKISDFMPEDAQTISKGCIRAKRDVYKRQVLVFLSIRYLQSLV